MSLRHAFLGLEGLVISTLRGCWWLQGEQDVTGHLMKDNEWEHKAERVLKHAARGPECWDCEFYHFSNPDLAELPCHDAFVHFVNYGQFEPSRPFRCVPDQTFAMHVMLRTCLAAAYFSCSYSCSGLGKNRAQ